MVRKRSSHSLYTGALPKAKRAPPRSRLERTETNAIAPEIRLSRLIFWLVVIILAVVVIGGVVLMFVDIPHTTARVEQPVSNETLGL